MFQDFRQVLERFETSFPEKTQFWEFALPRNLVLKDTSGVHQSYGYTVIIPHALMPRRAGNDLILLRGAKCTFPTSNTVSERPCDLNIKRTLWLGFCWLNTLLSIKKIRLRLNHLSKVSFLNTCRSSVKRTLAQVDGIYGLGAAIFLPIIQKIPKRDLGFNP